jgi:hypothetical protein
MQALKDKIKFKDLPLPRHYKVERVNDGIEMNETA